MIEQIIQEKFGVKPGLTIAYNSDNNPTIVDWPYDVPRPTDSELNTFKQQARMLELKNNFEEALTNHLNTVASQKNYDSQYTCVSFLLSTNATWKSEATTFNAWRDACWAYSEQILSQVESGAIDPPAIDIFIENLPKIGW